MDITIKITIFYFYIFHEWCNGTGVLNVLITTLTTIPSIITGHPIQFLTSLRSSQWCQSFNSPSYFVSLWSGIITLTFPVVVYSVYSSGHSSLPRKYYSLQSLYLINVIDRFRGKSLSRGDLESEKSIDFTVSVNCKWLPLRNLPW